MKMYLVSDEDNRLPVSFNALLSLFLLHSSQCRSSVRAPPRDGCVQFDVGGAVMKGRVQSDSGGVTQLSVPFQDAQTALQQLEVPLQVRGAVPDTHVSSQQKHVTRDNRQHSAMFVDLYPSYPSLRLVLVLMLNSTVTQLPSASSCPQHPAGSCSGLDLLTRAAGTLPGFEHNPSC